MEQLARIVANTWARSAIAIVAAFLIWRLSDAVITRFFARRFMSRFIPRVATYAGLAKSVLGVLILFALLLALLQVWDLNVIPALWSAGVISVVLGFGAQAIVRDLLAGIFFLFEDTFDVGDGVELTTGNGVVSGTVEAINLRETRVVDARGALVSVPNGSIVYAANTTRLPSQVEFSLRVPLREGVIALRQRLTEIAKRAAHAADAQVDHVAVRLDDVAPDSATYTITLHVARREARAVTALVRETIATKLQEAAFLPGTQPGGDPSRRPS